ncbi:uncharacterized protein LOC134549485 isoform X2 [Prinia subflava]|uniref:uncharacterized protein LOC134549485 isoform X2 n=1 Tax=Prinia subflava TaxID=208062 RepID=UPI002FE0D4C0
MAAKKAGKTKDHPWASTQLPAPDPVNGAAREQFSAALPGARDLCARCAAPRCGSGRHFGQAPEPGNTRGPRLCHKRDGGSSSGQPPSQKGRRNTGTTAHPPSPAFSSRLPARDPEHQLAREFEEDRSLWMDGKEGEHQGETAACVLREQWEEPERNLGCWRDPRVPSGANACVCSHLLLCSTKFARILLPLWLSRTGNAWISAWFPQVLLFSRSCTVRQLAKEEREPLRGKAPGRPCPGPRFPLFSPTSCLFQ